MRILIIGGTNFMGPFVVQSLHAQGHDVTVFHRGKTTASLPEGAQEILGDRRSYPLNKLQSVRPDVVLDMIPIIEQDGRDVMRAFKGIARRVVTISS